MSRSTYKTLQKAIARDDKHSIESRWEYGRAILADPKKMAPSGKSLRHGAIESLIADGRAVGSVLSSREIQYRIQCARTYKSINEIRKALADFETWSDLISAGFPLVYVDELPIEESLAESVEADPQEFEQLGLFPAAVRNVPIEQATMRQIVAYTDDMSKMTASYARSDTKRRAHCAELLAAVDGDLDCLYVTALDALTASKVRT